MQLQMNGKTPPVKYQFTKFSSKTEKTGKPYETSWEELKSRAFIESQEKDGVGSFYGLCEGNTRAKGNYKTNSILVYDIDASPDNEAVPLQEALREWDYIIESTHSHDPENNNNCFRVLIRTTEEIVSTDYETVSINFVEKIPYLKSLLSKHNNKPPKVDNRTGEMIYTSVLDNSCFQPSRWFYHPSYHPDRAETSIRYINQDGGMPYLPDTQKRAVENISSSNQLTKQPINELLKGSVEGTRHNDCIRISGMLFNKGMSLQDVLELMLGWNTKCIPPRDEKEVTDEVENIHSKYHPDNPLSSKELVTNDDEEIEFKFLGREDRENLPPVDWYIDRLLRHKGIGSIIGQERNGKSFVAIDLACRISRGMDFFGHETKDMKPVLYVALEDWDGINIRIKGWETHHGVDANVTLLPEDVRLGFLSRGLKGINKFIEDCNKQGFSDGVIIFDTLQYLIEGMDENGAKDMGQATGYFKTISKALNSFVIYVHHIGKDKTKGSRGSSVLNASLDTRISVHNNHEIKIEKVKGARDNVVYGYQTSTIGEGDYETLVITSTARGDDKKKNPKGKLQIKVLDYIRNYLFKFNFEVVGNDGAMMPYIKLNDLQTEVVKFLGKPDIDGKSLVSQSHKLSTEAKRIISDLIGSPYHCLKKGIDSEGVEFVHNNPN